MDIPLLSLVSTVQSSSLTSVCVSFRFLSHQNQRDDATIRTNDKRSHNGVMRTDVGSRFFAPTGALEMLNEIATPI